MSFNAAIYSSASYNNCIFTTDNIQSVRSINPTFNIVDGERLLRGRLIINRADIEQAVDELNSAGVYTFELLRNDADIQLLQNIYNDLQNLLDWSPNMHKYYLRWSM